MVALAKPPSLMTTSEFVNWNPGDHRRWQLVDGEPRAMAPAYRTHGALQAQLARLIGNHLIAKGGSCSVVTELGVVPHVLSEHNLRVSDLGVTCTPYVVEEAAISDPVLLVEILSQSNQADTRANVWAYMSIPSVREILVLHAQRITAELLRRQPDGSWPERAIRLLEGELALESIDMRVDLAELYVTTRLARR